MKTLSLSYSVTISKSQPSVFCFVYIYDKNVDVNQTTNMFLEFSSIYFCFYPPLDRKMEVLVKYDFYLFIFFKNKRDLIIVRIHIRELNFSEESKDISFYVSFYYKSYELVEFNPFFFSSSCQLIVSFENDISLFSS